MKYEQKLRCLVPMSQTLYLYVSDDTNYLEKNII